MVIKGTSCYQNVKSGNLVSITGDGGNAWGFYGKSYKKLAPRLYLWQFYENNPDLLSDDELIDWYIKEFYKLRLQYVDPYYLLNILKEKFGEEIILLCHELPGTEINKEHFCHRRLIADWLELKTDIVVPEIATGENGTTSVQETYDLKVKIKRLLGDKF